MFDHIMSFVDEVAAHADPIVGKYWWTPGTKNPLAWHAEANPNILVWDPAMDTTETVEGSQGPHDVVVHHPIDGRFRVVITLAAPDDNLVSHPQLELAVDHETGEVLNSNFTEIQLQTLHMQPVFAGSQYPFLGNEAQGLV